MPDPKSHTVDLVGMKPLSADLACERADTGSLIQLNLNRLVVVAEETVEGGGEGFTLLGPLGFS